MIVLHADGESQGAKTLAPGSSRPEPAWAAGHYGARRFQDMPIAKFMPATTAFQAPNRPHRPCLRPPSRVLALFASGHENIGAGRVLERGEPLVRCPHGGRGNRGART